jgi:flagellar biosynthesis protein FlhG
MRVKGGTDRANVPAPTICTVQSTKRKGWESGLPPYVDAFELEVPLILAVGGGKGGVGKSLISANLAAQFALSGHRVLVVDGDLGGANLHTYFGMKMPKLNLSDYLSFGRCQFSELLCDAPIQGLKFIAGGGEESWGGMESIPKTSMAVFLNHLIRVKQREGISVVVIDLGAGTHRHTVDLFCASHLGLMTVLPEPTSIENVYGFLKTVLFGFVDNLGLNTSALETAIGVKEAVLQQKDPQNYKVYGYREKLGQAGQIYPGFINQLWEVFSSRHVGFILNQTRSHKDIEIGESMTHICKRYFGFNANSMGYLNFDDAAWKSLRNRRLLSVDFAHSLLARKISKLATSILSQIES